MSILGHSESPAQPCPTICLPVSCSPHTRHTCWSQLLTPDTAQPHIAPHWGPRVSPSQSLSQSLDLGLARPLPLPAPHPAPLAHHQFLAHLSLGTMTVFSSRLSGCSGQLFLPSSRAMNVFSSSPLASCLFPQNRVRRLFTYPETCPNSCRLLGLRRTWLRYEFS